MNRMGNMGQTKIWLLFKKKIRSIAMYNLSVIQINCVGGNFWVDHNNIKVLMLLNLFG